MNGESSREIDLKALTRYAKMFTALTPEKEAILKQVQSDIIPHISEVTEKFYSTLQKIPEATPFLENKVDHLKQTHKAWMQGLFTGPYDECYTEKLYKVGDVHVKVNLPVEFMSGGITLIGNELLNIVCEVYQGDTAKTESTVQAINAVLGFSLFVMQKSYNASVGEALERFLLITGMSRPLYNKLASTFDADQLSTVE